MDPPHTRERRAEALGEAGRPADQVTRGGDNCAVLSDRPQSKIAKTPALDEACVEHALERALYRMPVSLNATGDFARVQFLPRSAHKEGKRIAANPAAAKELSSHTHDVTTVVVDLTTTVVKSGYRATARRGAR
jgi:hypothetical protein